jgi:2'-5' RNA ligase
MTLMRSETILPECRIRAIGWTVREIVLVHSLLGRATHRPVGHLPLRGRQLSLPGFDF